MFSCEFCKISKNTFLQNTSGRLLLNRTHIFWKNSKQTKRKRSVWVKPWLKNCMYTSAFNNIFAELVVDDKEEFRRYLRINTATYHYFFYTWQNNRDVLHYTSLPKQQPIQWSHWGSFSTAAAAAFLRYLTFTRTVRRCRSFHYWCNATVTCFWFCTRLLEFSVMSLCKKSFSSSNARLPSSVLK